MLGDRVDHLAVGVLHQLPSHRRRQSARAGARAGSGRGALAPPGLLGRSGSGDLEYPSRTSTVVQKTAITLFSYLRLLCSPRPAGEVDVLEAEIVPVDWGAGGLGGREGGPK